MWIEKLKTYTSECNFSPPASLHEIKLFEKELGLPIHEHLKSVLLESNGIIGEYGLGLLWELDRIKTENVGLRTNEDFKDLYMPFDHLLFFADAGNGDLFAYPILNGRITRNDIFVWNHEDDSRKWVAPSLEKYFEWWIKGEMKI